MRKTRKTFRNVKKGGGKRKKKKKKIKMPKPKPRKPKPYVWTKKRRTLHRLPSRASPTKKRPKSAMKTGKGKRSKTKRRR